MARAPGSESSQMPGTINGFMVALEKPGENCSHLDAVDSPFHDHGFDPDAVGEALQGRQRQP